MSVINTQPLIGASGQGGGYNLERSLRFRASASAYLNRTPSVAGNRKTFTYSTWVKRGTLGNGISLMSCSVGSNTNKTEYGFASDQLLFETWVSSTSYAVTTNQVFRDPAAYYNIILAVDTTQATASNRVKIYINGNQVTSFSSSNYPPQNSDTFFGSTNNTTIGQGNAAASAMYFDGYLAETIYVDGQQLDASSFGKFDSNTGVWQPARYTGTYGTNGFILKFEDNSAATAAAIGKDSSGNGNNWTPNNISLTADKTYDSMTDVPTLTSETASNYAVLNPLSTSGSPTIFYGNLWATMVNNGSMAISSIAVSSGKWYVEVERQYDTASNMMFGFSKVTTTGLNDWTTANGYAYFCSNGNKYTNSSGSAYGASYGNSDTIGLALDLDAGTATFYKNGVSQGIAFSGLSGTYVISLQHAYGSNQYQAAMNFGQQPWKYAPPSGFKALNTYNLPDSAIPAGNKVMDATTYTGTGNVSRSISNQGGFKPDLVWIKDRTSAYNNFVYDSIRGTGSTKALLTDYNGAEGTNSGYTNLSSFDAGGFSLGTTTDINCVNASGHGVVAWQWQAGQGNNVTNTSGSITSTVSANPSAGFSIVTYTGDRTSSGSSTVGHGLGVAPSLIITKRLNGTSDWVVQTPFVGQDYFLLLDTTAAIQTSASTGAGTLPLPTSTTFGVTYYTGMNVNGQTCVAYCWAEIAGFSKAFSYTGNGSASGPFVYLGFRARYLMIKRTDSAGSWFLVDTARNPYNIANLDLFANASDAEAAINNIDILSNGFRPTDSNSGTNANGGTFVGMAFAENPFKNSLAR